MKSDVATAIENVPQSKNIAPLKVHMNRILAISAKNNKPNLPELYSILKPETKSLSPSAKSKGARFVSERMVTIHISKSGRYNTLIQKRPEPQIL